MTDSQIIAEAMGVILEQRKHGYKKVVEEIAGTYIVCTCGRTFHQRDMIFHLREHEDPDYTDPTSYLEAMAWARKQDWWVDFAFEKGLGCERCIKFDTSLLDPTIFIPKLASYIKEKGIKP